MDKLVDIFSEIKNESSRTGKESILEKYKNNNLFIRVLKFVYNSYIVTGISKRKINKKVDVVEGAKIPISITGVMDYLKKNNSGRDVDIYIMQQCIKQVQSSEGKELLEKIITKDLKIGITAKTINKVYGEKTIPTFSVMLAESFDKREKFLSGEFYVTIKLDGNRSICVVNDNSVKFYTRSGKPIIGMKELENEFLNLPNGVYDGEILLKNTKNLSSDELFQETQKVMRKKGEKTSLQFYIFDTVTRHEFDEGKSRRTYSQRRNYLDSVISKYTDNSEHIILLGVLYKGSDKEVIPLILKEVEEQGYEGVMINTADGLYESKRTNNLLKVKTMKSADLLVVNLIEGTGRNKGRLGRANVEYKGGLTGVGSGFSDSERDYYWENPDEIVGKIIEVQYFEESIDEKSNQPSLRFPVFKHIREDKSVKDINYE